jgi:hypothetical protein
LFAAAATGELRYRSVLATRSVALLVTALAALPACRKSADPPAPAASASAAPSGTPVDHLAPGELAQGTSQVFGVDVPLDMRIQGQFADVAYLEGRVAPEAVANYVRDRVEVAHVEIGAAGTVFPNARIKRGAPDRSYQFEVLRDRGFTRLVIRDTTPRQDDIPAGTSVEERWRRAGRSPDGRIVDPNQLR